MASYAGYDIVERQSGTLVKGQTRISKKGNTRIRACMHFPALVTSRFNTDLKQDYQRIIENKASKMVGVTAIQRKLLLLMYALWKKMRYIWNLNKELQVIMKPSSSFVIGKLRFLSNYLEFITVPFFIFRILFNRESFW